MKSTPKNFREEIERCLAEFSIEIIKIEDEEYTNKYNKIHEKYLTKIMGLIDKKYGIPVESQPTPVIMY